MGLLKRGWIYLTCHVKKTSACFLVLFLVGSLLVGAVTLYQGILALERMMWLQLPPVAELHFAPGSWDDVPDDEWIPIELMRLPWRDYEALKNLPFVERTESLIYHLDVHSPSLSRVGGAVYWASNPHSFFVYGLDYPTSIIFENETKIIIEGRYFTESEVKAQKDGLIPLLVSFELAEVNDLTLHSHLQVETGVYNPLERTGNPLFVETITFQIIGIYQHQLENLDNELMWEEAVIDFQNWAYAPLGSIQKLSDSLQDDLFEIMDQNYGDDTQWQRQREVLDNTYFTPDLMIHTLFILHSPHQLEEFAAAANEILEPRFVVNSPRSYLNENLLSTLYIFEWYAGYLIMGAVIFSLVILTLMVLIILKERKFEFVQYLVLGEKKLRIVWQLMIEQTILFLASLGFSLLTGMVFAKLLSRFFLRRNLLESYDGFDWQRGAGMMLLQPRTPDFYERIDSVNISLDWVAALQILSLAFGIILVSTLLASLYLMVIESRILKPE